MEHHATHLLQALGQDGAIAAHALGDALQALGPVVDRIHAGHHRRQHLGGANIGGGFLAPNVLLTGLQGQPVSGLAVNIDADPDQATGHGALVFVFARQIRGVRAARAHGHAKALRGADHDVSTHLAWGFEQGQGEQIGTHNQCCLVAVDDVSIGRRVNQRTAAARISTQGGKVITSGQSGLPCLWAVGQHHFDAQGLGPGLDHLDGLRVAI